MLLLADKYKAPHLSNQDTKHANGSDLPIVTNDSAPGVAVEEPLLHSRALRDANFRENEESFTTPETIDPTHIAPPSLEVIGCRSAQGRVSNLPLACYPHVPRIYCLGS